MIIIKRCIFNTYQREKYLYTYKCKRYFYNSNKRSITYLVYFVYFEVLLNITFLIFVYFIISAININIRDIFEISTDVRDIVINKCIQIFLISKNILKNYLTFLNYNFFLICILGKIKRISFLD